MQTYNETLARLLAEEVQRQVEAECEEVLKSAGKGAKEIVAAAFSSARARGHEAILAMRQEGRRRLILAEAKRQTRMRTQNECQAAEALQIAIPLLQEAVLKRWRDPESRNLWLEALAREACARLLPGRWTVEHPLELTDQDKDRFVASLKCAEGGQVEFKADAQVRAGVRIRTGGALLDGTSDGLLSDRPAVEAMLLAELCHRLQGEDAAKVRP